MERKFCIGDGQQLRPISTKTNNDLSPHITEHKQIIVRYPVENVRPGLGQAQQ